MSQAVAVVTGASQGIGHSTAVRLARDFSSIALVARNRGRLDCNPAPNVRSLQPAAKLAWCRLPPIESLAP
jgi:NAD(P)-dependent dehydrogenase (short-subunit alcohol dehydrogenase family)